MKNIYDDSQIQVLDIVAEQIISELPNQDYDAQAEQEEIMRLLEADLICSQDLI